MNLRDVRLVWSVVIAAVRCQRALTLEADLERAREAGRHCAETLARLDGTRARVQERLRRWRAWEDAKRAPVPPSEHVH